MIQIKKINEKYNYQSIYSDRNKKILEVQNEYLWNNSEEEPIYVNIDRYNNNDYTESEVDCDPEEDLNEE